MKKIILTIILALVIAPSLWSQNRTDVRAFEFEIGTGFTKGVNYIGMKGDVGIQFLMEARLNLKESPFDIGMQFSLGGFTRKGASRYIYDYTISPRPLITFVDYNYRKWKNVSLFGGLGIGMAAVYYKYESMYPEGFDDKVQDWSFVANPRIGAEFFDHIRLTFDYKLLRQEYSFWGLTVGFVFGGGLKE